VLNLDAMDKAAVIDEVLAALEAMR